MAIPFYNQSDQDIYAGGEHFIPQERFRLGYMAPPSIANAQTTSGITNTQAASPYIWPPQGGGGGIGGGGPGSSNKFGLDMDTLKTISQPRYVEQGGPGNMYGGNYVKDDRDIAQTEGGIWKDVKTGQNVYHGNIQEFPSIIKKGFELAGLKQTGDPYAGTWTGAEWDDEFDPTVANRDLNVYTRWKAKREFKAAQERQAAKDAKDAADAAAVGKGTDVGGGWTQTNTGGGGATFTGGGGQTHQGWSNTPAGIAAATASEGSMQDGGLATMFTRKR